jgi:hypothetical protein
MNLKNTSSPKNLLKEFKEKKKGYKLFAFRIMITLIQFFGGQWI